MRTLSPLPRTILRATLFAALYVAALPLAAQNPAADQTSASRHFQAVVVRSTDGKPVARVLVTSPDRRLAVMTDSEGRFSFDYRQPDLPMDFGGSNRVAAQRLIRTMPLQLMVRKPGYTTNNLQIHLPAAGADTSTPLVLKIVPAAIIAGHISTESGEVPPGMYIQLQHRQVQEGLGMWMQSGSAQVNSRGEFRFPNLAPGDYKLVSPGQPGQESMRLPQADSTVGLLPAYYPEADSLEAASPIHLAAGDTVTADLAPRRATFYHVSIPVGGGDGTRGFSATMAGNSFSFPIRVNAQTQTIECYLPSGSYAIRINSFSQARMSTPGGVQARVSTPGSFQAGGDTVQLSAIAHVQVSSAPVHAPPVVLSAAGELPVIVRRDFTSTDPQAQNGGRAGAQSVMVSLQSLDPGGIMTGLAPLKPGDSDDMLKVQNATEGRYRVMIYPRTGYVASVISGSTDLLRDPLVIGPGGAAPPIEITLRDDYATLLVHVSGVAPTDAIADPTYLMAIPLDRPQSQINGNAMAFDDPTTIGRLPPGRYLVLASHQMFFQTLEFRNEDVMHTLIAHGTVVNISAGEKADVQVPLMPDEAN